MSSMSLVVCYIAGSISFLYNYAFEKHITHFGEEKKRKLTQGYGQVR
jgi:hypothetical protein